MERKWALLLSFIAVSLLAAAFLAPQHIDLKGIYKNPFVFMLTVTILALADSLNPCMISIMVLMIATLTSLGLYRKDVVERAALFTAVVYVTYLTLGVLIFLGYSYLLATAAAKEFVSYLKLIIAGTLILAGVINVVDVFFKRKPTLAIPEGAKGRIQELLVQTSFLATILLAVFVTLVELPCTGIFYIGLIAFLRALHQSLLSVLPILVYYNILFVLPEIWIIVAVWRGIEVAALKKLYTERRDAFRLLEGVLLIVLALLVWWVV